LFLCRKSLFKKLVDKKDGEPFLEIHHIKWLSNGGDDSIDNTVALCPNCHRKMHALNLQKDIISLRQI
jgi:5-methylcytosine-specific restriction enzyme A